MTRIALILAFVAGCATDGEPAGGPLTPADVAADWFSAAAANDKGRMARSLDPRCVDAPVGEGAPADIMGTSVKIDDLDLVTTDITGDKATVAYSFRGEVRVPRETHEARVDGEQVTVTTAGHDVDMGGKSGNLLLVKQDGVWKVSCTFAGLRNP